MAHYVGVTQLPKPVKSLRAHRRRKAAQEQRTRRRRGSAKDQEGKEAEEHAGARKTQGRLYAFGVLVNTR